MAFSWLYKEKVKGLLATARNGYGLCLLIQNVIITVYLLCMGGFSLIISDQEDEAFGKF